MSDYERLDTAGFIREAKAVHGEKYDYSEVVYKNTYTKVIITCRECGHRWDVSPDNHRRGGGCTQCSHRILFQSRRKSHEVFLKEVQAVHGERFEYLSEYKGANQSLKIRCMLCGHISYPTASNHLRGNGCAKCKYKELAEKLHENRIKNHGWFLERAREVHGEGFEYLSEYKGSKEHIEIRCKTCDTIFYQEPRSHLSGQGCPNCHLEKLVQINRMPVAEFEEKCKQVHGDAYEYFGDYTSNRKKVRVLCRKCNFEFNQSADVHLNQGSGCPKCNASKGERRIETVLTMLGIDFEIEKKFPECRNERVLEFDFYIPSCNLCIEFDGGHHYCSVEWFGGEEYLAQVRVHDQIKNEFCLEYGITLLRIPYFEYDNIETILKNTLDPTRPN